MNWPHIKTNPRQPDITSLQFTDKIPLGDIVIELPNDFKQIRRKKDYIFWGKSTVKLESTKDYGDQYFFTFEDTPLVANWGEKTLEKITNISKVRDAAKTGALIDLMLCGSFYKDEDGNYHFIKRTKYVNDYIVIN